MTWWMNFFNDQIEEGLFDLSLVYHAECARFCFMNVIKKNWMKLGYCGTLIESELSIIQNALVEDSMFYTTLEAVNAGFRQPEEIYCSLKKNA